jgi:hypothetical protein
MCLWAVPCEEPALTQPLAYMCACLLFFPLLPFVQVKGVKYVRCSLFCHPVQRQDGAR